MEKILFKDYPDTTTPIDADNLNLLQDNIEGEINLMKEKVLYDNSAGTTGNITLSETIANFSYIEIYYRVHNQMDIKKIPARAGNFTLNYIDLGTDDSLRNFFTSYTINETSISKNNNTYVYELATVMGVNKNTNYFTIHRVIGYK